MSSRLLRIAAGLITLLIAGSALACSGAAVKAPDKASTSSAGPVKS